MASTSTTGSQIDDPRNSAHVGGEASQWIVSPLWDTWWMFSGLWAPTLIGLGYLVLALVSGAPLSLDQSLHQHQALVLLFLALGVLHRMTTTYAVLATPILRDNVRRDPSRYLYIPATILLGCLLLGQAFAFHSAFSVGSTWRSQLWAFFVLAYVMVLWERWHFCMQEFGVLSMYRTQALQFSAADRRFDRVYTVVLMLVVNSALYICIGFPTDHEILLLGTPLTVQARNLKLAGLTAFTVGMGAMVVAVVREWKHALRSIPKLAFYVLIGAHTLLLYFFPAALGLFFLTYTFHHWMVAIGLFNRITLSSYGTTSWAAGLWRYVTRVGPFFVVCLGYYLLFNQLNLAGNPVPVPGPLAFTGVNAYVKALVGLGIGVFFAFNFLHFYYDRCFYKFGDPAVRERIGPLLFGPPRST